MKNWECSQIPVFCKSKLRTIWRSGKELITDAYNNKQQNGWSLKKKNYLISPKLKLRSWISVVTIPSKRHSPGKTWEHLLANWKCSIFSFEGIFEWTEATFNFLLCCTYYIFLTNKQKITSQYYFQNIFHCKGLKHLPYEYMLTAPCCTITEILLRTWKLCCLQSLVPKWILDKSQPGVCKYHKWWCDHC